jgi:hypothetical protein
LGKGKRAPIPPDAAPVTSGRDVPLTANPGRRSALARLP